MSTIVMTGYGAKVRTVDGILILEHGEPGARETIRLGRSQRKVRHLVLAGKTGYVTLAALRWCQATGITITVLDHDGSPQLVSANGAWLNGTVRRSQARSDGVEICRLLIQRKLEEQAITLQIVPEVLRWRRRPKMSPLAGAPAVEKMAAYHARLEGDDSLEAIAVTESLAGRAYWRALAAVSMAWKGDVPEHWRTLGRRHHPPAEKLRKNAYAAMTPGQALINYGYGYLLAETVQACYSAGLDPAIGYLHRAVELEQRGGQRPEFAFDLMEPVRPVIDRLVLEFLSSRTFTRPGDAVESPSGGVHLSATIRRSFILSCAPVVRKSLSILTPHVVRLVRSFGRS